MIRLFVGLNIPEDVRRRLAALLSGLAAARWVDPASMHITLRFIGEVDEAVGEHLADALAAISAPAFEIAFAGLGTFNRGRKVTTLWAGVAAEPRLDHLHAKMESALVRAGLEPEARKFSPHVTLARFRARSGNSRKKKASPMEKVARWLEAHGDFRTAPFAVGAFSLLRSHLGHGGAHYEEVAAYPLSRRKANLASVSSIAFA